MFAYTARAASARLNTGLPRPTSEPPPPTVILYVNLVHELREDNGQYMFSLDRIYTSLSEANARLALIARCNTSTSVPELIHAGEDPLTGCQWLTWTKPGTSRFHFYGEVRRILMQGEISTAPTAPDVSPHAAAVCTTEAESRYLFNAHKDLPGHVWAVAVHHPYRQSQITLDRRGKPLALPWEVDSVHPVSGNALAQGKRVWAEQMLQQHGKAERMELHYGFARYVFAPLLAALDGSAGGEAPPLESRPQVRVERSAVVARGEMTCTQLPAEAIRYNRPFQPLCPGREDLERMGIEGELDDVFFNHDLGPEEEVAEIERRLKRRYLNRDTNGRDGTWEKELWDALGPGDVEARVLVGKTPVGNRGVEEGVKGRMSWLYHSMLK